MKVNPAAVTNPAASLIVTTPAAPLALPKTAVLALSQMASVAPLDQFVLVVLQFPLPSTGTVGLVLLASQVRLAASVLLAIAVEIARVRIRDRFEGFR